MRSSTDRMPLEIATATGPVLFDGTVTAGPDKREIDDGSVDESTMTLATKSPDGQRRIVFTGTVRGDELEFLREITVPADAPPGGAGLFGVSAPRGFTPGAKAPSLTRNHVADG